MDLGQFTVGEWFLLAQHELLLFAAVFFAFGVIDELAVDLVYFWLRITGRGAALTIDESSLARDSLAGHAAIFLPAWQESAVIGPTLKHMISVWPQPQADFFIGCYANDPDTVACARAAAGHDSRVKIVIHDIEGPTSKADCLNRLYQALREQENSSGVRTRMVVLHDAEDMVDPAALAVLDQAIATADFVQLPVLALPQRASRLIGSHYSDEFAEAHGRTMVVRDALGAAVPGAGVGTAIARSVLTKLGDEPFASQSLTEEYELGLRTARLGLKTRFLRCRTRDGRLIATRAYFPARLKAVVRQKTRWMHGIALQSWDRLGWSGSRTDLWMQLRDRRGPLAAILLAIAYLMIIATIFVLLAVEFGLVAPLELTPLMKLLLGINLAGFGWRIAMRAGFTAREYGWRQGLLATPRAVVSNIITIVAGWRAMVGYIRTLRGAPARWDKTDHRDHPTPRWNETIA